MQYGSLAGVKDGYNGDQTVSRRLLVLLHIDFLGTGIAVVRLTLEGRSSACRSPDLRHAIERVAVSIRGRNTYLGGTRNRGILIPECLETYT